MHKLEKNFDLAMFQISQLKDKLNKMDQKHDKYDRQSILISSLEFQC